MLFRSGDETHSVPFGVRATIILDGDTDVRAHVEAGCNTGSAQVTIDADHLDFGPLALTRKMCEPDAMAVESAVTEVLTGRVPYLWQGTVLVLGDDARSLVFRSDLP